MVGIHPFFCMEPYFFISASTNLLFVAFVHLCGRIATLTDVVEDDLRFNRDLRLIECGVCVMHELENSARS